MRSAIIILYCVLITAALADIFEGSKMSSEVRDKIDIILNSCFDEVKNGTKWYQKVDDFDEAQHLELIGGCTYRCYFVKLGFMTEAGLFNPSALKSLIASKFHKTIEDCAVSKHENLCYSALLANNCILLGLLEYYFKNPDFVDELHPNSTKAST